MCVSLSPTLLSQVRKLRPRGSWVRAGLTPGPRPPRANRERSCQGGNSIRHAGESLCPQHELEGNRATLLGSFSLRHRRKRRGRGNHDGYPHPKPPVWQQDSPARKAWQRTASGTNAMKLLTANSRWPAPGFQLYYSLYFSAL